MLKLVFLTFNQKILIISVFASGGGSNFRALLESKKKENFRSEIVLLVTNNSSCGAAEIAREFGIDVFHYSRVAFPDVSDTEFEKILLKRLRESDIDFIVLAGFMKKIPELVVNEFNRRIINIHPALLPSFGGKGMYGINVHKAVLKAGSKVSGITIHYIDNEYDHGEILFQKCIEIGKNDDEFSLQKRVLELEHTYYWQVIKMIENKTQI